VTIPTFLIGFRAKTRRWLLSPRLATLLRRPVQDNTGLRGAFAFKVECSDADSLPAAIQEQLGLRLTGGRIKTKSYVIEAAEKPSEN
jgi:uncharacterized protein (TIGR03435 family)